MQYIVRIRKLHNVFVQSLSDMLIFDNEEKLARCQELLHRHGITYETFEVGKDAVNPDLNLVYRCVIPVNGEIMVQPYALAEEVRPAEMLEQNGHRSAAGFGLTPEEAIAAARKAMKGEIS
jgi:hypothetical protein